jgi:hypothetical protein
MQTRILAVATMLVATIFASIAFAQEAPPEPPEWVTWMKAIAEPLIEPLALILGAVALVLARRVSTWIAAKLGVEDARALSLIEGQVVKVVDGGIAYTEQRALTWAREHAALPDSAAKLQWAIEWIAREAKRRGLPELGRDALIDLIESRLGDPHAPGSAVRAEVIASRLAGAEVDA